MKQIVGELNYLGYLPSDLSNRTKPNKKPIEPNRTPIVRLGWAIEQNRTNPIPRTYHAMRRPLIERSIIPIVR